MTPRLCALVCSLWLGGLATGCADSGSDDDGMADTSTDGGMPVDVDPLVVPTDEASLIPWLQAEAYLDWPSESAIHDSAGPHFGNVRTWIHPDLMDSLDAGSAMHPAGVGAVKELYGDGNAVRGWAVSAKVAEDSQGGDGWYWFEIYDGGTIADGEGLGICTGCHGGGGVDYVLTPYPLQ